MIIDKENPLYSDIPDTLNGEILLRADKHGIVTCSQKIGYMYAASTLEQKIAGGHDAFDYTKLDMINCERPTLAEIESTIKQGVQNKINNGEVQAIDLPVIQERLNTLNNDMANKATLDESIRHAMQISVDIENAKI